MKRSGLDTVCDFNKDDTVAFAGTGLILTFTGASTATMDNDDVISDATFIFLYNNTEYTVIIECVNGVPGIKEFSGYNFILEYADGYNQVCGLRVKKL